jgi:hypothetical protein
MSKTLLITVALALAIGHVGLAQISLSRKPFLTSDQITAALGGQSAAAAIVPQALAEQVRVYPTKSRAVIGAQIPDEWLPMVPDGPFTRLADDEARTYFGQCGKLLFVDRPTRTADGAASIDVVEGHKCGVSGQTLRFAHASAGDAWRLTTDLHQGRG